LDREGTPGVFIAGIAVGLNVASGPTRRKKILSRLKAANLDAAATIAWTILAQNRREKLQSKRIQ